MSDTMKTEGLVQWYTKDGDVWIKTDSFGASDGSTEYHYSPLTPKDLVTMLETLGADVRRKQKTKTVYLDNNPARLDDGPMRFDKYDVTTVVVETLKEKGRTCCG